MFTPILLLYPVLIHQDVLVGAPVSDVWNGVWSLWWMTEQLFQGSGICSTQFNYPTGGCIVPSDWTGVLLMLLLRNVFSPIQAFNGVVWLQVGMIGVGMMVLTKQLIVESSQGTFLSRAFFAGLLLQLSTVVLTGLHNGSTEVLSLGWVLIGLKGYVRGIRGDNVQWLWVLPVVATSWYGVVGFVVFAVGIALAERPPYRTWVVPTVVVLLLWFIFAGWVLEHSTGKGNVIFIKSLSEMDSVRRTIGSSDPLTYVVPWMYRSPDFSEVSRYGENFVHSSYVGCVALIGLRWVAKEYRWLLWVGLIGCILSLGPVLVIQSEPLVFDDRLGIPLPYFLLERVPFFSSLTLLYRLSWIPIVAIVMTVVSSVPQRWFGIWTIFALSEVFLLSPNRDLPSCSDVGMVQELSSLQDLPDGTVAHYPLVGGRPHMLASLVHKKPTLVTLNFSSNATMNQFLQQIDAVSTNNEREYVNAVGKIAKQKSVRYWIIDEGASTIPDEHWHTVERVLNMFPIVLSIKASEKECQSGWRKLSVVQLW